MFLANSRIEWFTFLQEIETFLQKIQMLQLKVNQDVSNPANSNRTVLGFGMVSV